MQKLSLSVICPVYNEEAVISSFYNEVKTVLDLECDSYDWSIVFILDKSSDQTQAILEGICSKDSSAKLLLMSSRYGTQMALVAGIDHSDTDLIIMMDSDLQHPPSLIPKLIEKYNSGYDIVGAIRTKDEGKGRLGNFLSKSFYKCWNHFSGLQLSSGEADYRLITRRVADVFRNQIREQNQFLRGLFYWVGFKRATITYKALPRIAGETKFSFAKLLLFAVNSVVSFSKLPLQYSIYVGIFCSCLSVIGIMIVVYDFIFEKAAPSGWYTLAVMILFFSGLQLFFVGVVGQYIGMIFDEVKKRPLYIIDRRINFD
jgi:polyisoprenyl-phosphate glycosyltransferase